MIWVGLCQQLNIDLFQQERFIHLEAYAWQPTTGQHGREEEGGKGWVVLLGPCWGHVGASLCHVEAMLRLCWLYSKDNVLYSIPPHHTWVRRGQDRCKPCGATLGHVGHAMACWSHLGDMLGHVGPCWAILGQGWGHVGPSWNSRACWVVSWGYLGAIFEKLWRIRSRANHFWWNNNVVNFSSFATKK